jgi:hypothetical protein
MPTNARSPEYDFFGARFALTAVFVGLFSTLLENAPLIVDHLMHTVENPDEDIPGYLQEFAGPKEERTSEWMYERLCGEFVTCQTVDAFMYYLSQILRRVFMRYPECLGGAQADVREVLECADKNEFIQRVVDRKVHSLSYKGLRGIVDYLNRELGLGFDATTQAFQEVCEFFEVRNIIVHNGGFVSQLYLRRTGRTDLQAGDQYPLTKEYVITQAMKLLDLAKQLDILFGSHFNLASSD